ncbi:MAG: HEAT repeat domain-containing protein [Acidiferrobacterales bacterium]|nr:HEAT repeat domain-containing protein [Acidiferrobacterales bacterium]
MSLTINIRRMAVALLALSLAPAEIQANGWEHTSLPVSALISALNNENVEVRRRAAHSLGHHQTAEVAEVLIGALAKGESNVLVRRAVFGALGRIGDARSVPAAMDCITNEPETSVRVLCALSLEKIRTEEAEAAAILATQDVELSVQRAGVLSLGNQGSSRAVSVLTALLAESRPELQLPAVRALGKTGRLEALNPMLKWLRPDTAPALLVEVLKAVTLIGSESISAQIKAVLQDSTEPRVRRHALIALSAIDESSVKIALRSKLRSENPLMRIQALEISRELKAPELVKPMLEVAKQYFEDFYGQSPDQIKIDPQKTIVNLSVVNEFLRTIIATDPHHADSVLRLAATPLAIQANTPALLTVAEGLYKARWQAIYGLGYTHKGAADDVLTSAFADKDGRLRAVAMRSMGVNDPGRFRMQAVKGLKDPVAEVRWQAATVLGRDKLLDSFEPLIQATTDPNSRVRNEAVLSLGYLKPRADSVRNALEKVSNNDADMQVRASALYALDLIQSD